MNGSENVKFTREDFFFLIFKYNTESKYPKKQFPS